MHSYSSAARKINTEHFGTVSEFFQRSQSDQCDTLLIACSDQGLAPDQVSFAAPGRFFILQHLGAFVPAFPEGLQDAAVANIQFALETKDIQHVVVCGHLGCQTLRSLLQPRSPGFGGLRQRFHDTVVASVDRACPRLAPHDRLERLVREHVLIQIENLLSHTFIRERLEQTSLELHAWVVDDETARVSAYAPRLSDFVSPVPS